MPQGAEGLLTCAECLLIWCRKALKSTDDLGKKVPHVPTQFSPGEEICQQGKQGTYFFIVHDGDFDVKIESQAEDGTTTSKKVNTLEEAKIRQNAVLQEKSHSRGILHGVRNISHAL